MFRPSIKYTPVDSDIGDAVSYAYSTLEELRDEIQEVVDNMADSPGLAATSRYETLENTAQLLDGAADCAPDLPECLAGIRVNYTENREKKLTRGGRRDNAVNAMDAVISATQDWIDMKQGELDALKDGDEDEDSEEDSEETVEDKIGELENEISEAETFRDEIEEHKGSVEEAEFPGMRG